MFIKKLSHCFSVVPQISVLNVQDLADRGFTTIICTRPDGEVSTGETSQEMRQAAVTAEVSFHYLPMVPGEVDPKHVEALRKILRDESGLVVGYCRTGARAAKLWAMMQTE